MKKLVEKSSERGHFNFNWLDTHHSFSFGSYFNREKMGFGALRVLNDDTIMAGAGFGTHPHEDMEIITIPLSGVLNHKDSTGTEGNIVSGDVQVMSAGTGIFHSEYNGSDKDPVSLLQIWILPEKYGIQPRYDQKNFNISSSLNQFKTVVTGDLDKFMDMDPTEKPLWINQKAYLSLAKIEQGKKINYSINDINNGAYFFLIEGKVNIDDQNLEARDSLSVYEFDDNTEIEIEALDYSYLLAIEVPM